MNYKLVNVRYYISIKFIAVVFEVGMFRGITLSRISIICTLKNCRHKFPSNYTKSLLREVRRIQAPQKSHLKNISPRVYFRNFTACSLLGLGMTGSGVYWYWQALPHYPPPTPPPPPPLTFPWYPPPLSLILKYSRLWRKRAAKYSSHVVQGENPEKRRGRGLIRLKCIRWQLFICGAENRKQTFRSVSQTTCLENPHLDRERTEHQPIQRWRTA